MTSFDPDEDNLHRKLQAPRLDVPADFVQRVMSALPERPAIDARRPALRWLQAAMATLFGALGAIEVLLFIGGLWFRSSPAFG